MAKFKSLWACPVYVATFADGTTQRMSFASPAGKPIDFGRGRRLLAWAWAQLAIDRSAEVAGYKLVRHTKSWSARREITAEREAPLVGLMTSAALSERRRINNDLPRLVEKAKRGACRAR